MEVPPLRGCLQRAGEVAVGAVQPWLRRGDVWPLVLRVTQSDAAVPEGEPGHAPLPGAGRKGGARAPVRLLPQPSR